MREAKVGQHRFVMDGDQRLNGFKLDDPRVVYQKINPQALPF
jgi:hypothetical protein